MHATIAITISIPCIKSVHATALNPPMKVERIMISAEIITASFVYNSFVLSMLKTTWNSFPPETNADVVYTRKNTKITTAHTSLINGLFVLNLFCKHSGIVIDLQLQ